MNYQMDDKSMSSPDRYTYYREQRKGHLHTLLLMFQEWDHQNSGKGVLTRLRKQNREDLFLNTLY